MSWRTIESDPGINLLIVATVLHFTDAGAAGVVFSTFYVLKIRLGTCSWRKPLKFSLLREEFLIALDTFSHTETHQESIKRFQSYLNDRDTSLLSVGIKRATSSINRNGFESLLNVYKETDALQKNTRILRFMVLCLYRAKHKRSGSAQGPNTMIIHPRHSGSDQDAVKITVTGSSVTGGATSETLSLRSSGPSDMHIVEAGNIVISIQVLRNVPNNFSRENILGRGGFGTVYKCELHDGTKIAVKRMESGVMSEKGLDEFKSEIAVLTKVRHRHLVALLGYLPGRK